MTKERAATICRLASGQLIRGSEAQGDSRYHVRLNVGCPGGGSIFALHHTHPGGKAEPSLQDIAEARRLGISKLCVEVPETGEMRCYRV